MAVTLNQLMDFMVAQGASDLHIAVGRKPVIRKSGHLKDVNAPELTAADTIRQAGAAIPREVRVTNNVNVSASPLLVATVSSQVNELGDGP